MKRPSQKDKQQDALDVGGAALETLSVSLHVTMGKAMAAVLLDKDKADVTVPEALEALRSYENLVDDDETRQKALRAGWCAIVYKLQGNILPAGAALELSRALSALNSGVTVGMATPVKNSRRAGAADYDGLAKYVAMEVAYHQGLLDLAHDAPALSLVTGVKNPDSRKSAAAGAATIPLPSITWEQAKDLLRAGRKLLGAGGVFRMTEFGRAVATGLLTDADLAPEHKELRQRFANPIAAKAAIAAAFAKAPAGRKPRQKKSPARKPA